MTEGRSSTGKAEGCQGDQLLCPFFAYHPFLLEMIETLSSSNSPTSDFQSQSPRIGLISHGGQVLEIVFIQHECVFYCSSQYLSCWLPPP